MFRIVLITFFASMSTLSFTSLKAQDIGALTREAERLEAIPNEKASLSLFREVLRFQPTNLLALVKASELCSRIGGREKVAKVRDSYNNAAISYAKTAIKYHPNSDQANVAIAIAVGRTMLKKSGKEKIALVKDIRAYADKALRLNPNNFKAWHILGKWNFEIQNLSMVERTIARVFYGGVPESSLERSIRAYENAHTLNPHFALNYLELARAYHKNGGDAKAIGLLKTLQSLPIATEDDPRIKKEGAALLGRLQS